MNFEKERGTCVGAKRAWIAVLYKSVSDTQGSIIEILPSYCLIEVAKNSTRGLWLLCCYTCTCIYVYFTRWREEVTMHFAFHPYFCRPYFRF